MVSAGMHMALPRLYTVSPIEPLLKWGRPVMSGRGDLMILSRCRMHQRLTILMKSYGGISCTEYQKGLQLLVHLAADGGGVNSLLVLATLQVSVGICIQYSELLQHADRVMHMIYA